MDKIGLHSWYTSEALLAVNQSVGRAIRSTTDYGAIILLDCRYANMAWAKQNQTDHGASQRRFQQDSAAAKHSFKPQPENPALSADTGRLLPGWLRPHIFPIQDVRALCGELQAFFTRKEAESLTALRLQQQHGAAAAGLVDVSDGDDDDDIDNDDDEGESDRAGRRLAPPPARGAAGSALLHPNAHNPSRANGPPPPVRPLKAGGVTGAFAADVKQQPQNQVPGSWSRAAQSANKPVCAYDSSVPGKGCYRKAPAHFLEFSHPAMDAAAAAAAQKKQQQ
jgi:hypothetical protein